MKNSKTKKTPVATIPTLKNVNAYFDGDELLYRIDEIIRNYSGVKGIHKQTKKDDIRLLQLLARDIRGEKVF